MGLKAVVIVVCLVACVAPAEAERFPCGDLEELTKRLAQFRQIPTGNGLDAYGQIVKFYASPSGAWTVVVVRPPGKIGCIVGAGGKWRSIGRAEPVGTDV